MAVASTIRQPHSGPTATCPPLENGDRLTREEFECRYDAMPHLKKAELIEGVVYLGSPVRVNVHGAPNSILVTCLGTYQAHTRGTEAADNTTVRLDLDDELQPDAFLRILPEFGGQSQTSDDGYVEGAPELVAEIAASSVSLDLHAKKEVYRKSGVREYLVWRVLDAHIDWWILRNDRYVPLAPDENGIIRSQTFPGLWLDVPALLRSDSTRVLEALQQGLASAEHTNFTATLKPSEN